MPPATLRVDRARRCPRLRSIAYKRFNYDRAGGCRSRPATDGSRRTPGGPGRTGRPSPTTCSTPSCRTPRRASRSSACPGRPSGAGVASDGLEGYARTFLLAAFRIAGAGGEVPPALIERYADGLADGTDPATRTPGRRRPTAPSRSSRPPRSRWRCTRPAPGCSTGSTRHVQERVVAWLAGFVGKRTWQSNWVLFPVMVEQFLADVGGPHDPAEIDAGLDRIEQWYVGDGWYTDGDGRYFDYYAGWAMHLYPLLWARMSGDRERGDRYRERLRAFLDAVPAHLRPRRRAGAPGPVADLPVRQRRAAVAGRAGRRHPAAARPHPADRQRRAAALRRARRAGRARAARPRLVRAVPARAPSTTPGRRRRTGPARRFLGLLLPPTIRCGRCGRAPRRSTTATGSWRCPARAGCCTPPGTTAWCGWSTTAATGRATWPADGLDDPHYARFGYASHAAPETGEDGPRTRAWTAISPSSRRTARSPAAGASSRSPCTTGSPRRRTRTSCPPGRCGWRRRRWCAGPGSCACTG